jgi:predicted nucleotidyltransferase
VRSLVQKKSFGSVTVFWLDRELAQERIRQAAKTLGRARPEVVYVGLFGSLAEGRAVPGSDADLILILRNTERRFLDRPLDYFGYFSDVDLGVDLFCYTHEEVQRVPLAVRALKSCVTLWGEKPNEV